MSSGVVPTPHVTYMEEGARRELIEILYEVHSYPSGAYYEFFWYHWPRDGFFWWDDYEPIVFAYDFNLKLCFALVRRAWKPLVSNPNEIAWPPEVLFEGQNHHQYFRMSNDSKGKFDPTALVRLSGVQTTTQSIRRVASSRGIIDGWIIRDIYERVERILADFCLP